MLLPGSKRLCLWEDHLSASLEAGHVVRVVVRAFVCKKTKNNGTILLLPHPTHVCAPCEEPRQPLDAAEIGTLTMEGAMESGRET